MEGMAGMRALRGSGRGNSCSQQRKKICGIRGIREKINFISAQSAPSFQRNMSINIPFRDDKQIERITTIYFYSLTEISRMRALRGSRYPSILLQLQRLA